ncbi:hypothetical protein ACP275_05G112700 [Erythranthe tilingii]
MEKKLEDQENEGDMKNGAKLECDCVCESPLYDAHELVSVANIIERHMMVFPFTTAGGLQSSSSDFQEKEEICIDYSKKKKKNVIVHKRVKNGKIREVKSTIFKIFSRVGLIMKK